MTEPKFIPAYHPTEEQGRNLKKAVKKAQQRTKNKKYWMKLMSDKPCYRPALPFYDFCININSLVVKHVNCEKCIKEKGIYDVVE